MGPLERPLVALLGGDAPTRATLQFLLLEDECEVVEMATMEALLTTFNVRPVDLVAVVAEKDAAEILAMLRQPDDAPQVLLLTRSADQAVRRRAFALGALDVISLPASPRDLRARLSAALRNRGNAHRVRRTGTSDAPAARRVGGRISHIASREGRDEQEGDCVNARRAPRPAPSACVLHVLFIGDTRDRLVLDSLRAAGYATAYAPAAHIGETIRRLQPAMLVIDIEMMGGCGLEACRRLRRDPQAAAISVIACATGAFLRAHRREIAATDYLTRPFSGDELSLRVQRIIGPPPTGLATLSTTAPI